MKKNIVKFASILLSFLFLVNPLPAHATALLGMLDVPATVVLVKNADETGNYVNSFPVSSQREARRKLARMVTAYSSTPDQTDSTPFITANGTRVHDGIVAANWLKFNTRIRIPELYGDKVFIVTDRMNARFSNRMDIWMETRQEAQTFGLRRLTIEIF